jgi:hypothetical protein
MTRFVILIMAALIFAAPGRAAQTELKSDVGGVTIAVTPVVLSPTTDTWTFRVVFDTHSQQLDDDMARSAVLVDAHGTKSLPTKWEGAAPGGHHREGVLHCNASGMHPGRIELHINRPAESSPRTFRWQME